MADRIEPRLVKGMRDQVGAALKRRTAMIEAIRGVFERFGFQPLETPVIELREVLTGAKAGETGSRIYHWRFDDDQVDLGLRFDLTVPLARFVAANPELRRPFKRYQLGPVFRVDKPGAGRFREFLQFDIDTVGTRSMMADAEILLAMGQSLQALGLIGATIRWNHRGVLNAALRRAGIAPESSTAVIRVIDKLDKIGNAGVRSELGAGRVDAESGARIEGVGLPEAQIRRLEDFLQLPAADDASALASVRALLHGVPGAEQALEDIDALRAHLDGMGGAAPHAGDAAARVVFTPQLARGMDYYTGPIFEATLDALPEWGSIMGGGRYDELVSRFSGESLPGVGASIGVDRLLAALDHVRQQTGAVEVGTITQVLVTLMDKTLVRECQQIVSELRAAGVRAEIWLQPGARLGDQLKYASAWSIPYAVILGSEEHAKGIVTVKDLEQGRSAAAQLSDRADWIQQRPGQFTVERGKLAASLAAALRERAAG